MAKVSLRRVKELAVVHDRRRLVVRNGRDSVVVQ
jgi:hypothetical protein